MLQKIINTALSLLIFTCATTGGRFIREIRCDCGVKNEGTPHLDFDGVREYSGNHVWPWMISIVNITITDDPVAYCGGSLINDRYIMTAAHCIPDMNDTGMHNFRIHLGTNHIANEPEHFLDIGILEVKSHPQFNFDTADNDIALIKLSEIVTFTKRIRPVCLKQEDVIVGKVGIITGWGSFNLTTPTEEQLKQADVEVVLNDICAKNYSTVDIPVTNTMLCASLPGQDPCKGDSGGPLILKDETTNKYNQVGIISHGEGCAVQAFPAIFSRVSVFIDWIVENTRDARFCKGTF